MAYAVGQRETITITDLLDEDGDPVDGETLTGTAVAPDGTTHPLTSTNPGGLNDYRIVGPEFDQAGRWHWHLTSSTPDAGFQGEWIVDYSPAAPVPP